MALESQTWVPTLALYTLWLQSAPLTWAQPPIPDASIPPQLRVPSNLTLLPGHLYMMAEALAKEEARRALEMPS